MTDNDHDTKFRKLIENIDDTVTVVDQSGSQLWTSAAMSGDLGYEGEFWKTADLFALVHSEDRSQIDRDFATLLADPDVMVSGEVRLVAPSGEYRHVGYVARNLLDDADIGGIVITSRSVEVEVQARIEREGRQRELEEALADRARFIARMSHEMRSPLHAIQGLAELLLTSDQVVDVDKKHIRSIERESTALRHMLDDLLDLSKIGAGRMDLQSQAFSPAMLCDGLGTTHRSQAQAKGLELRVELDNRVPRMVLGDEHRLRQVLVNLISNAIKYTDAGSVVLKLEHGEGSILRFHVIDTGRGIPDEMIEELFQPYRQVRVEDTTVGTGIGLTITKMLTELMGGTITVDSSATGTAFTCEIPFREGRRAADREQVGAKTVATSNGDLAILVVDDSEINRTLAEKQIERLGYDSVLASGGREALELVATQTFDLVFMDWHMPEVDGLETTRRIRLLGEEIHQPRIVAVTASVMSGDREACLAAGMDDYLAKPVSIADIGRMINRWTGSQSASIDPGSTNDEASIDGSALESLIDELGDSSVAHSIVMSFLKEVKTWRSDLSEGVESNDLVTARRTAHTLKSTAAMLGAMPLSRACAVFEAEATTRTNADSLLKTILETADRAEHELNVRAETWKPQTKETQP